MMRKWKKAILCLLAIACVFAFPVQAEADLNVACPSYSLTSIDGQQITNSTNLGKTTLMIYTMLKYHGHQDSLLVNLMDAKWLHAQDLSIVIVDISHSTEAEVREYVSANGAENSGITFCTDESDTPWRLMEAAGMDTDHFSLPISFVIDRNGHLQRASMGDGSELGFRKLLSGYVADVSPIQKSQIAITGENVYSEAFEILRLLNIERANNGLSALKMDAALLDSAMLRAAECSVYYSHTRPNGEQCFTAFPAGKGSMAENIAIGYRSAADVMDGWMNSPGHRKNILTENFASAGIGVFYHNGGYTWVQLFSSEQGADMKTPADKTVTAKVETLDAHITLQFNPRQMMLKKNATKVIDLRFYNTEFPYLPVQLSSGCLTYRSENPSIAKVDANGTVTAVSKGTTRITVEVKNSNLSASFCVTVGEHTYFESVPKEPTCGETGLGEYICEDCGDQKTVEIPKLTTHSWDGGKVTKYPTTTQAGVRTYTCTVCRTTKTESIPQYSQSVPQPTQKPTTAPTAAPTVPPTKAPTAPATTQPPVVTQPTSAPTQVATVPASQPPTTATQPTTEATVPSDEQPIPIPEPTEMPSEQLPTEPTEGVTEPVESTPAFVPETQPTQAEMQQPTQPTEAATQLPTQQEDAPAEDADNSLGIGIVVAVAAVLAAGTFLLFWKKKK